MSDDMKMSGEDQIVPEGTVSPMPAPPIIKPGMARRNVFLIAAGVIVLVALVGFVAWALLLVGGSGTGTPSGTISGIPAVPGQNGNAGGTPSTSPTAALPLVPDVQYRDVFTPRDPFQPIKPVAIAVPKDTSDDSADDSNNSDNSDDDNADTSDILTLTDIVTQDGVLKAVVRLDGVTYTLGAGEQVGSSSYSIVAVNDDSVDVLHGDDAFTIMLSS